MPLTDLMTPINKRLDALEETVTLLYTSAKARADATGKYLQISRNRQMIINWLLIMWPALLIALEKWLF